MLDGSYIATGFATGVKNMNDSKGLSSPSYFRQTFSDLDEYCLYDANVKDANVLQLTPGTLHVDMEGIAFDDLYVRRFYASQSLSMESFFPEGWTSFILCTDVTDRCTWCGIPVKTHTFAVMADKRQHHYGIPAGWQNIDIAVSNKTLLKEGIIPASLLKRITSPDKGHLKLPSAYSQKLNKFLLELIQPEGPRSGAARQLILDTLAEAIYVSLNLEQLTIRDSDYERFTLVRRIERYAALYPHRVTHAQNVYDDLGVNRRSAERAFRQVLGVSPYRYLLNSRLQAARHILINPNKKTSVTDLAAQFGFASSSEFSRNYKSFYSESPTDSRRKHHIN